MKRLSPRKRPPKKPLEDIEDDTMIDEEPSEGERVGVVPAAATLLESLEKPLKRLGKNEAAQQVKKGAKKLRASADQVNSFVSGVSSILQSFQKPSS